MRKNTLVDDTTQVDKDNEELEQDSYTEASTDVDGINANQGNGMFSSGSRILSGNGFGGNSPYYQKRESIVDSGAVDTKQNAETQEPASRFEDTSLFDTIGERLRGDFVSDSGDTTTVDKERQASIMQTAGDSMRRDFPKTSNSSVNSSGDSSKTPIPVETPEWNKVYPSDSEGVTGASIGGGMRRLEGDDAITRGRVQNNKSLYTQLTGKEPSVVEPPKKQRPYNGEESNPDIESGFEESVPFGTPDNSTSVESKTSPAQPAPEPPARPSAEPPAQPRADAPELTRSHNESKEGAEPQQQQKGESRKPFDPSNPDVDIPTPEFSLNGDFGIPENPNIEVSGETRHREGLPLNGTETPSTLGESDDAIRSRLFKANDDNERERNEALIANPETRGTYRVQIEREIPILRKEIEKAEASNFTGGYVRTARAMLKYREEQLDRISELDKQDADSDEIERQADEARTERELGPERQLRVPESERPSSFAEPAKRIREIQSRIASIDEERITASNKDRNALQKEKEGLELELGEQQKLLNKAESQLFEHKATPDLDVNVDVPFTDEAVIPDLNIDLSGLSGDGMAPLRNIETQPQGRKQEATPSAQAPKAAEPAQPTQATPAATPSTQQPQQEQKPTGSGAGVEPQKPAQGTEQREPTNDELAKAHAIYNKSLTDGKSGRDALQSVLDAMPEMSGYIARTLGGGQQQPAQQTQQQTPAPEQQTQQAGISGVDQQQPTQSPEPTSGFGEAPGGFGVYDNSDESLFGNNAIGTVSDGFMPKSIGKGNSDYGWGDDEAGYPEDEGGRTSSIVGGRQQEYLNNRRRLDIERRARAVERKNARYMRMTPQALDQQERIMLRRAEQYRKRGRTEMAQHYANKAKDIAAIARGENPADKIRMEAFALEQQQIDRDTKSRETADRLYQGRLTAREKAEKARYQHLQRMAELAAKQGKYAQEAQIRQQQLQIQARREALLERNQGIAQQRQMMQDARAVEDADYKRMMDYRTNLTQTKDAADKEISTITSLLGAADEYDQLSKLDPAKMDESTRKRFDKVREILSASGAPILNGKYNTKAFRETQNPLLTAAQERQRQAVGSLSTLQSNMSRFYHM